MIARAEFDAYNAAVEEIAVGAEVDARDAVLAWCRENPGATVAEKREAAKLIMEGVVQSYDEMAAALAAEWYDHRAEAEGARLEKAITVLTYNPEDVNAVARYQARKLIGGGDAAFAEACGEFARNDAMRSLNETIVANAGRDKRRGVRFARVTTGRETCAFCIMLAGRGAVYHTREKAGEFKHYHRRCDCKVVPGFEDDPMATLVEGHDPRAEYRKWKRIESAEEVDSGLYSMSADEIAEEAAALDKAIAPLFRASKKRRDYAGIFEVFLSERGRPGLITAQHWAKPEGKELQLASWLAGKGHDVEFLLPSQDAGAKTPDIRLDGELWEIKRITTANPTKAKARIGEALRQSGNVIVDLSTNENAKAVEFAAIEMLDDERANRIMIVRSAASILYKK